jgi:hypothetical protein
MSKKFIGIKKKIVKFSKNFFPIIQIFNVLVKKLSIYNIVQNGQGDEVGRFYPL